MRALPRAARGFPRLGYPGVAIGAGAQVMARSYFGSFYVSITGMGIARAPARAGILPGLRYHDAWVHVTAGFDTAIANRVALASKCLHSGVCDPAVPRFVYLPADRIHMIGGAAAPWWSHVVASGITDGALAVLAGRCRSLRHLSLEWKGNGTLTDRGLASLRGCRLSSLDVHGCRLITDYGLAGIVQSRTLRHLSLRGCVQLTNSSVRTVGSACPNLQTLDLMWCRNVTDDCLLALSHILSLTSIDLSWCFRIGDAGLCALSSGPNTGLRRVAIDGCGRVGGAGIAAISETHVDLQSLSLCACGRVTNGAVRSIATHCPGLAELSLVCCTGVGDGALVDLARHCTGLLVLDLCGCRSVTDDGIVALAQGCWELRSLNLRACGDLTDMALLAMASGRGAQRLHRFTLSQNRWVTDEGGRAIGGGCRSLRYLELSNCPGISRGELCALMGRCPHLRELVTETTSCAI